MSTICWLAPSDGPDALPEPSLALDEPNGLLAAGGTLRPDWLLASYASGIFPWYEEGQPILWWCPDPRAVLWPDDLRISRSLRRTLARNSFEVTADLAFDAVIDACAEPRRYTDSTWITADMAAAYRRLHALGWAHSFEAWQEGRLAGGLYGISIGRMFFGESMFSRTADASKVAFAGAVRYLKARGVALIDCQIQSGHLTRLGAVNMPRAEFLEHLKRYAKPAGTPGSWRQAFAAFVAAARSA
ncbi:leucyl/phenylalanyl-tRNA--protein transferase [Candidatus Rariloculus sp.]|uniref:leucyl/phenylalanyl-tRNA--protein transferase n=1 Tax=Candidatus Rariloculus sp. TaxID=3101265 RepID=UPI003D0B07D1